MKKRTEIILCSSIIFIWLVITISLIIFLPKKRSEKINKLESKDTYEIKLTGAVNFPGYYTAVRGDKVSTLVNYAMGLKDDADVESIELSREIRESEKVIEIPYKKLDAKKYKINLNTASYELLKASNLLSENKIVEILIYRKENGSFTKVEELMNIKGIGDATFKKIKDSFTV